MQGFFNICNRWIYSSIYANQPMGYTILINYRIKIMFISIYAEKAFDKIQHSFMIEKKISPENGHGGDLPQHNTGRIWQIHNKHHSQWWKTESIFPKIRKKARMSTLITLIQHSFGSSDRLWPWVVNRSSIHDLWRRGFQSGARNEPDHSEILCSKVLLKCKGIEKASDTDIRRGQKECFLASF